LDEKRKHARFVTRMRVWCEGDNVTLFGRVGNLGEGGLFVHTGTPFAQGARARVRLKDLGSGGEVQAHATVVWARRPGARPVVRAALDPRPISALPPYQPIDCATVRRRP